MPVTPNTLLQRGHKICLCQPCFKKSLITALFLVHRILGTRFASELQGDCFWCLVIFIRLNVATEQHFCDSCYVKTEIYCIQTASCFPHRNTHIILVYWNSCTVCLCNLLISAYSSYFCLQIEPDHHCCRLLRQ